MSIKEEEEEDETDKEAANSLSPRKVDDATVNSQDNVQQSGELAALATGELNVSKEMDYIDDDVDDGLNGLATEINAESFEELHLDPVTVAEVQSAWNGFIISSGSRGTAGEAVYSALFESAPSLQSLFKSPRAVMAMRFINGLGNIVQALERPAELKVVVETLGFQHMDLEVTVPRVAIFRDALVDLLSLELGMRLSLRGSRGWSALLNYAGGAYIFVRLNFVDRLRILAVSWATANKLTLEQKEFMEGRSSIRTRGTSTINKKNKLPETRNGQHNGSTEASTTEANAEGSEQKTSKLPEDQKPPEDQQVATSSGDVKSTGDVKEEKTETAEGAAQGKSETRIPTTYKEMFSFNAAVMGFRKSTWMNEVSNSFDIIVMNVSNSYRLQEECDVLSLRIAKYKGTIKLFQYKAVMLASLRALIRDWGTEHEVAWSWLWDNVEHMLRAQIGKPVPQERALERLLSSMDDAQQDFVRNEVYAVFFALIPRGQDFFKQSTTRLHFIADRIMAMTLEMFKQPSRMVEDISALGLRHVGYDIPTDMFAPFVSACVQVVRSLTEDAQTEEGFRWSLNLISRILVRVVMEGATIVMKAVNRHSPEELRKAVACAPRGKRPAWVLSIQVGTHSISPLLWALETGSLEAARAIISDLLTFRADRDNYYYGMNALFSRHEDFIKRLCIDAPGLCPTLLDGLIWRSRIAEHGMRRVNYYIKHLIVDSNGNFAQALEWLTDFGDPKLISHPLLILVSDLTWSNLAFRIFLCGKSWFLFTLCVFVLSQAVLKHISKNGETEMAERVSMFCCRCFIYTFSMGQWIYFHVKHVYKDVEQGRIRKVSFVPVPLYLSNYQDFASLLLTVMLVIMFAIEPIMFCLKNHDGDFVGAGLFTQMCPDGASTRFAYSLFSMAAMALYFFLLLELSIFSTKISAFVLVVFRVLSEVGLFLFAFGFVVLTFACATSALQQGNEDFTDIATSSLSLKLIAFRMYSDKAYKELEKDSALLLAIISFVVITCIFLANVLVAQLNSAYMATYEDNLGYARLNRGIRVIEAMPSVSKKRWELFLTALDLETRIEFGIGDVGLSGGIQVLETAAANVTTVDTIKRFGGSTSPLAQWPLTQEEEEEGRGVFDRIESKLNKAVKRARKEDRKHKKSVGIDVGKNSGNGFGKSSSDQGQEESGSICSSYGQQSSLG